MSPAMQVLSILLSAAAALVGALVLWNLRLLNHRLDALDHRVDKVEAEHLALSQRKESCQREFVDVEQWIRSESYSRSKLDGIAESVSNLTGSLKVIEQMPRICGQIARDIVKEFRNENGG